MDKMTGWIAGAGRSFGCRDAKEAIPTDEEVIGQLAALITADAGRSSYVTPGMSRELQTLAKRLVEAAERPALDLQDLPAPLAQHLGRLSDGAWHFLAAHARRKSPPEGITHVSLPPLPPGDLGRVILKLTGPATPFPTLWELDVAAEVAVVAGAGVVDLSSLAGCRNPPIVTLRFDPKMARLRAVTVNAPCKMTVKAEGLPQDQPNAAVRTDDGGTWPLLLKPVVDAKPVQMWMPRGLRDQDHA
jgi:hypothetical protein